MEIKQKIRSIRKTIVSIATIFSFLTLIVVFYLFINFLYLSVLDYWHQGVKNLARFAVRQELQAMDIVIDPKNQTMVKVDKLDRKTLEKLALSLMTEYNTCEQKVEDVKSLASQL